MWPLWNLVRVDSFVVHEFSYCFSTCKFVIIIIIIIIIIIVIIIIIILTNKSKKIPIPAHASN